MCLYIHLHMELLNVDARKVSWRTIERVTVLFWMYCSRSQSCTVKGNEYRQSDLPSRSRGNIAALSIYSRDVRARVRTPSLSRAQPNAKECRQDGSVGYWERSENEVSNIMYSTAKNSAAQSCFSNGEATKLRVRKRDRNLSLRDESDLYHKYEGAVHGHDAGYELCRRENRWGPGNAATHPSEQTPMTSARLPPPLHRRAPEISITLSSV